MREKADWIYARVLRKGTFIFPRRPYWFGWVEFVPMNQLDTQLSEAIAQSLAAHGIAKMSSDDEHHVVVRTIVLDSAGADVEKEALARIREAIDLFTRRAIPLPQTFEILRAGALIGIVEDTCSPLRPPWKAIPFTGALMDDRAVHPSYILNLLLAAPGGFGQLGLAYARSQHWRMLAEQAASVAEKVLLHWMAVEALCSTSVGADPIPNLMYACGFPLGRRSQQAASYKKRVPRHGNWRKRIFALLEATRRTRNGIVHEGHRDVDIRTVLGPEIETDALLFLKLSVSCLHVHAESWLHRGAAPLAVLWNNSIDLAAMEKNATWIVQRLETTP